MYFIALIACTFLALIAAASSPASARVGVTSVTSGEPLGRPPAEAERILRVGIDVQANERITTTADDRAHLVFLDGTSLSIGPNSVLVIDRYVFDPDRNTGEMTITASRGVIRFVGGAISKKSEVQIKTPSATVGIRGGIATVAVNDAGATTATFLYGQSMTVSGQGALQVATRNGSQVDVPPGGRPGPPMILPPGGFRGDRSFERPPPGGQHAGPPPQQGTQAQPNQPPPYQPASGTQTQGQTQPAGQPPPTTGPTQPQPQIAALVDDLLPKSNIPEMNSGNSPNSPKFAPTGPRSGRPYASAPGGPPRPPAQPPRVIPNLPKKPPLPQLPHGKK